MKKKIKFDLVISMFILIVGAFGSLVLLEGTCQTAFFTLGIVLAVVIMYGDFIKELQLEVKDLKDQCQTIRSKEKS